MRLIKKIKNLLNVRNLPHPERPNYLGANMRCGSKDVEKVIGECFPPKDALDRVGVLHDRDTRNPKDVFADWKFTGRMLRINPFDERNYDFDVPVYFGKHPLYIDPRIYQYGSAVVMGLLGFVTIPARSIKLLLAK